IVDEAKVEADMAHIQATVLPSFKATLNGKTDNYYMGSFYGAKYCGVNRSKSAEKIKASLSLANWFTSEEGQEVRFDADGSGPSNNEVLKLQRVKESKGLNAYKAQLALGEQYNCVMGKQKQSYWDNIPTFTTNVFEQKKSIKDKVDYTTEKGVLEQLKKIADKIDE
ncbi:MAG: extracellular solute-binding protein, partial [Clostridiales bacterium]|nr:extracellular solute-binding protein [Clostridiales bacterium]